MNEPACPRCHSPRVGVWNERDERIVASVYSRSLTAGAIARLRDTALEGRDGGPLLGDGVLERFLPEGEGARVRQALVRLADEATRDIDGAEPACPQCGAPCRAVFTADGEPAGHLYRTTGGEGFREALADAAALRVAGRPAAFSADNPYYEDGDESAPFLSEAYLYVLFGKDEARSVLGAVRGLAAAMGEKARF